MTDLPDRLRAIADTLDGDEWEHPLCAEDDCRRAADEIERLTQLYREARRSECGWECSDRYEYHTQHLPDCQAWIQQFDEETERQLSGVAEAAGGES